MDIIKIKQKILNDLVLVNSEYYQDPKLGAIFTAILLYRDGITQDQIIQLTKVPRTMVSESLAELRAHNMIMIQKRSKDRKNYYMSKLELSVTIKMYLQYELKKFEENTTFIQGILTQLEENMQIKHEEPTTEFFKLYLNLFQHQNNFVLEKFHSFLSGHEKPQKLNPTEQAKLFENLSMTIQGIFGAIPTVPQIDKIHTLENPQLDVIKKNYIKEFMNLMAKTEKNPLYPAIINITYIERNPPTQDRYIQLLNIPRSTLSEAIKKVEEDHLIKSIRFPSDGKIHYFPTFPRPFLLPVRFYGMIRRLLSIINQIPFLISQLPQNLPESQYISQFLLNIQIGYNEIVDFLFHLVKKLELIFNLELFINE